MLPNTGGAFDLTGTMWDYMATVHRCRSTGASMADCDLHASHSDKVGDGVEIVDGDGTSFLAVAAWAVGGRAVRSLANMDRHPA